jgi:hypothetical protein
MWGHLLVGLSAIRVISTLMAQVRALQYQFESFCYTSERISDSPNSALIHSMEILHRTTLPSVGKFTQYLLSCWRRIIGQYEIWCIFYVVYISYALYLRLHFVPQISVQFSLKVEALSAVRLLLGHEYAKHVCSPNYKLEIQISKAYRQHQYHQAADIATNRCRTSKRHRARRRRRRRR